VLIPGHARFPLYTTINYVFSGHLNCSGSDPYSFAYQSMFPFCVGLWRAEIFTESARLRTFSYRSHISNSCEQMQEADGTLYNSGEGLSWEGFCRTLCHFTARQRRPAVLSRLIPDQIDKFCSCLSTAKRS